MTPSNYKDGTVESIERHQRIQRMLEHLGIHWDETLNYALYQLHEIDFIAQKVSRLVHALDEEAGRDEADVERLTKALATLKVEIYDHLPDHLSDLRRPLEQLFERLCELEGSGSE